MFKKGHFPWNKDTSKKVLLNCEQCGKKFKIIFKNRSQKFCSQKCFHKARCGEKNHFWKGDKMKNYPLRVQIRECWKYKEWRSSVYERDNYTCQFCGSRKSGTLNAHHWKEFVKIIEENNITTIEQALACEELWNINNGITLCEECHKGLHKKN